MMPKREENDKKLAEILNSIDEELVDGASEGEVKKIGNRIGRVLRKCNYPKEYAEDLREYAEYLPEKTREVYCLN